VELRARGLAAGVWNNPPALRVELRTLVAAVAVAVLSQVVLWGTYAYATDGCFCAISGSTGFPTAAWIYPTLRVTSAPAPGEYLPLPMPYLIGTLLNVAAWTAATYAALKVASMLGRAARAGSRA
jgi:hypothetical protein